MPATKPILSSYEAKLLYALIDAAHDDGLIRSSPLLAEWLGIKQIATVFPNVDRAALYHLAEGLDATGAIANTWMRERWLIVKRRVESDPMEFPASQAPFPPRQSH
jgi:hypothetical protein